VAVVVRVRVLFMGTEGQHMEEDTPSSNTGKTNSPLADRINSLSCRTRDTTGSGTAVAEDAAVGLRGRQEVHRLAQGVPCRVHWDDRRTNIPPTPRLNRRNTHNRINNNLTHNSNTNPPTHHPRKTK
jgi:hypothetical protein